MSTQAPHQPTQPTKQPGTGQDKDGGDNQHKQNQPSHAPSQPAQNPKR